VKRAGVVKLVGSALLAMSLLANVFLGRATMSRYEAESAVRLDPAGLKFYAADRGSPEGGRLAVIFGDSRAAMWPAPVPTADYSFVNRGIGYQTTAQLLLRIDADVMSLHPAVVVVEAGVNDLKTIADFPSRRGEIVADCEANLATIVRRCREAGAAVVLTTVFDIGDVPVWRRPFWSSDVGVAVREVNAFLARLAGEGVVLFDASRVLDDDDGRIAPGFQFDHLHLSPRGYAALNARLAPVLAALPKAPGLPHP
jgi:lysophospholipase L1-like esterase